MFSLSSIGNGNYRNDELVPVSGHEYKLEFMYDDILVTSTTQIPSKPTNVSSSDFNYIGTYTVSVIHICYEYAVMSQGGSTSSTTLVDMKGNVDGGYGIFTGINSVSRNIKVSKGSSPF